MQAEKINHSGYATMIAEATGAPDRLLHSLEEIMRDEIYHSTLDWQSAAELRNGARKAYARYWEHQKFYDAESRLRQAMMSVSTAEDILRTARYPSSEGGGEARALANLEAAKFEAAARVSLDQNSYS